MDEQRDKIMEAKKKILASCNLTTLGCLRSFKVPISLFICPLI